MSKIGFIGVGLMGGAMVECLQKAGHEMIVLGNRDRTHLDRALERGASEAANARDVAEKSEIVMLCMGTSEQVEGRMRGSDGVIAGLQPGAVVIDFGTSLPESTRELGGEVSAAGGAYLDAPLGRTPAHAVDGLLNIMCSGDKAAFEKVKPVLDQLGENVFHLGELGAGHTIKLLNNFFAMTTANAMAEVFAMADKAGVSRQGVYDVMSAGPLHSGMMDFVKAYGIDGNPEMLAFAVKNANKDVGYYAKMAEDAGVKSIMSTAVRNALGMAVEDGWGERLVPEMVDYYAEKFS